MRTITGTSLLVNCHITRCLCGDANNALALISLFRPNPLTERSLASVQARRSPCPHRPRRIRSRSPGSKGKVGPVVTVRRHHGIYPARFALRETAEPREGTIADESWQYPCPESKDSLRGKTDPHISHRPRSFRNAGLFLCHRICVAALTAVFSSDRMAARRSGENQVSNEGSDPYGHLSDPPFSKARQVRPRGLADRLDRLAADGPLSAARSGLPTRQNTATASHSSRQFVRFKERNDRLSGWNAGHCFPAASGRKRPPLCCHRALEIPVCW